MPECETARRNRQAIYEIELAWGNGVVDLGKLRRILTSAGCGSCPDRTEGASPLDGAPAV
jgi:hypothetical protein